MYHKLYGLITVLSFFVLKPGTFAQIQNVQQLPGPKLKSDWATMMEDTAHNFYAIRDAFENYWQGKTILPGKGWKPFKRWANFWEPRVFPSGKFPNPSKAWDEFMAYKSTYGAVKAGNNSNWTSLGPSVIPSGGGDVGRINCIRFHPSNNNIIFIGAASGGLWKSTDGGSTWSTNTDNLQVIGVTDVLIDPGNPNTMYLATGDGDAGDTYSIGVLKSTDGGTTWSATGLSWTVNQLRRISKLIMHPSNSSIILAATSNGVYKTTDAGTSWSQKLVANIKDIEFKPGDPTVVYAGGYSSYGFYKSTNTGDAFSQITSGLPSSGRIRVAIAVTAANANYVYALIANSSDYGLYGVYRSTDSGTNFSTQATTPNILGWEVNGSDAGGQGWYDLDIIANPSNADDIYTGGVNHWRSTDGGVNWSCIAHWYGGGGKPYVHADVHALTFMPGSSTTIFSGNDGGIFKTVNNGTSWSDLSSGLVITQIYKIGLSVTNSNLLLNGNQDNGTNRYSSGSWTHVIGGDGMECIVDYTNANIMYGELYYGEIRKSTNGGSSFSTIVYSGSTGVNEDGNWVTPYIMHPSTSTTLLVGKSQIYRSTDGGSTWSQLASITGGTGLFVSLAYAPSNANYIYAAKSDKLWVSSNGGTSFSDISSGLPVVSASITYVAVAQGDPLKVWVTFSGYSSGNKVYYTSNGGGSWSNYSGTLPNIPANCIVYQNNSNDLVYAGMDIGVYYRDAGMSDWQSYMTNLPNVIVSELEIHDAAGKIRAGTYGRGTWESPIQTAIVANFSASSTTVCAGQTINFSDLTTGSPNSWTWTLNGGTPSSSSLQNPAGIAFNTPGTYTITLLASDGTNNDTETKTSYITVNSPATASAGSDATICSGSAYTLSGTRGGSATSSAWSTSGSGTFDNNTLLAATYTPSAGDKSAGSVTLTLTTNDPAGPCNAASDAMILTINPVPNLTITSSTNETCSPGSDGTATVNPSGATSPFTYSWNPGGQTNSTATGLVQGTYNVTVTDNKGCSATTSVIVSKNNCVAATKVRTADCGITVSSLNQYIYCDPVSNATNYRWEWVNAVSGFSSTVNRGSNSQYFIPSWVTGIEYGKTYDVRVSAYASSQWGSYGTVCQITTPPTIPTTKIRTADCGITISSLNQVIYCDQISGATNYKWEWVNAASGFSATVYRGSSLTSYLPGWVPGIQYGKTYDVRVSAQVGTQWGSYGSVCQITTPVVIPTTKVRSADCGITLSSLIQNIYCDNVSGAINYKWEWVNAASGFSATVYRGSGLMNFYPDWVPGIQYGKTYDVRIAAQVGTQWGSYGSVCQITTPASVPATKVRSADCGITLSSLNQNIYCDPVPGAVNYRWEWVNAASGFSATVYRGSSLVNYIPGWVPGIQYGKTYDVRVSAMVGTQWNTYGTTCQITTPASIPTTKIRSADCGITLGALSQKIYCDPVAGATDYKWEWVNGASGFSATVYRGSSLTDFYPSSVPGIQYGKTYDVRVSAYSGTQWGSYGSICQITTPPPPIGLPLEEDSSGMNDLISDNSVVNSDNLYGELTVFPNPTKDRHITIIPGGSFNNNSATVTVFDMIGREILAEKTECCDEAIDIQLDNLAGGGIYVLKFSSGNNAVFRKLLVE